MIDIKNKLVLNNGTVKFYTNDFTKSLQEYLHEDTQAESKGLKPVIFPCMVVYLAEFLDGSKMYVVVDNEKGCVVHESVSFESMCYWVDMLRFDERT